jgi:hypothetical protein
MATPKPEASWAPTRQACSELGISRTTLQKLKSAGCFKPGHHYYRRGVGRHSPCMWHVGECRLAMQCFAAANPLLLDASEHRARG